MDHHHGHFEPGRYTALDPDTEASRRGQARYEFAQAHLGRGRCLDIACGPGVGTRAFARPDRPIVAVDNYLPAVREARRRCSGHDVDVILADAPHLPFRSGVFSTAVSLETLEHVPSAGAFLDELGRTLAPGATIVVSTPNRLRRKLHAEVEFHEQEFTAPEFAALMAAAFQNVRLFGHQRLRSLPVWKRTFRAAVRALVALDRLKLRRVLWGGAWQRAGGVLTAYEQDFQPFDVKGDEDGPSPWTLLALAERP